MKKRCLFFVGIMLLVSTMCYSQTKVVSNHSFSLAFLETEYSYEQALGGNFSLIGRIGLVPGNEQTLVIDYQTFTYHFTVMPGITVEPRYYTSLGRREKLGRTTENNASDFVSIAGIVMGPDLGLDGTVYVTFVPQYGIRRTWGKHWYCEGSAGVALGERNKAFFYRPHLQFRVGFML